MRSRDINAIPLPRSEPEPRHPNGHGGDGYFGFSDLRDVSRDPSPSGSARCSTMSIQMPASQFAVDMAFTALQYLPMPVLVLSADKTVVMANEAIGRLFGIDLDDIDEPQPLFNPDDFTKGDTGPQSATDILYGYSMGELGIDVLQNGNPIWVTWDDFLESILADAIEGTKTPILEDDSGNGNGQTTPKSSHPVIHNTETVKPAIPRFDRTMIHEVVLDVVFSSVRNSKTGLPVSSQESKKQASPVVQNSLIEATLIISVWWLDGQQYFTLTFTATHNAATLQKRSGSRTVTKMHRNYMSGMSSGSSSGSTGRRTYYSSHSSSPSSSLNNWLPNGPANNASASGNSSTLLSKSSKMKDALLNALPMPVYAMWKDESFGIPNKAAMKLLGGGASDASSVEQREFLGQYKLFTGDFTRELGIEEYPIMHLMKTQKRFTARRVGMENDFTGIRLLFDVDGEEIFDEKTGEFLGGLVIFRDITEYANTISAQQVQNERQFEDIANMIPVMVWTADDQGSVDYFSKRWYDYTGAKEEESLGHVWTNAFLKDDAEIANERWRTSIATGNEYLTEYRCRSRTGEWRWMLGRGVPMKNNDGKIVKW